ncbi:MAG TPA: asparagine synthase (glutamine-hydrolyzing), partial [Candidatus Paceibacterota bacterium]|nr:asparagine synthase (glutamine-hydrolyzing) [Candidatus Paceibacterota bacterium]
MCGIIGFNWEDKNLLKNSLRIIKHRGPDYSGIFLDNGISLGHNRLAIIDLSKAGNQPMSNESGTIWITFNGEIYNFKELKKDLEKRHKFKSNTDTEVILHLYEEHGFDFLNKLQGMFAFCIYDSKKKILFLARDRVGIKPLYYYSKLNKFIFCSEIKGILQDKDIKKEINTNSISSFLTFRANTQKETLFKNIKKLMPGHFLVYDLKKRDFYSKQFWDFKINPENKSKNYFIDNLKKLLEDSVRSRLMSDVPYGAYLSGGIDSGTIISLMSNFSQQPIKTFSVGFEQEEHTETKEAKFLAEKLETDHHELLVSEDSIKFLPEIIYHADEPMSDPTSVPIYLLSKYTKKYCTVILTGEGSDEIFAGYPQYKFMKINQKIISKFPQSLKKSTLLISKKTPPILLNKAFKFASALGEKGMERFSNFINSKKYSEQYLNQISIFNEQEQSELLNRKVSLYKKYESYFKNPDLISSCQRLDFKEPMVDDLLMKIDKNTMAFAVEGRVPFLDHRIIELAFKMPLNLKLRGFTKDKFILREAVKKLIPEQTRNRKKKHFFVPIDN